MSNEQTSNPCFLLIDLRNKFLNNKSTGNPQHDLMLKIICSDKSDCIPQFFLRDLV